MKKKLVVIGYGGMGGWHTRAAEKSDVVTLGFYIFGSGRYGVCIF